jgi:GT2 family glycosyltransferase
MNTIPTTSKRLRIPYTVVGGQKSDMPTRRPVTLSLLLINRGGRPYKTSIISELENIKAAEIISIEGPSTQYDTEALSRRFPHIRFLILGEEVTTGEKINIGIEEAKGKFVFVIWNDMAPQSASISERLVKKIVDQNELCVVPLLQNQRKEVIPSIHAPAFFRNQLKIIPAQPVAEGARTIIPFDFCGIYSKERFTMTGGFDYLLRNPYWQKLDFSFRSYMWGEQITCSTLFRMSYLSEVPSEDSSRDESYKLFFLKNLAIRFSKDSGRLPAGRFLSYVFKSGVDIVTAFREFKDVLRWVDINKYRFKRDAKSVTELWETNDL